MDISKRTKVIAVVGIAALAISAIKDYRDNTYCCCDECCIEEVVDPIDPTI